MDAATRLHVKVSELAGIYTNALGHLQNEAGRPDGGGVERMAGDLAREVVQVHRDVDALIDSLEASHGTETEQLRALEQLQLQHADVTRQLRVQTDAAAGVRAAVRGRLDGLLDEVVGATADGGSSGRDAACEKG